MCCAQEIKVYLVKNFKKKIEIKTRIKDDTLN